MILAEKISAFNKLGDAILKLSDANEPNKFLETINSAHFQNPWFTPEFCKQSINAITNEWLNTHSLNSWVSSYPKSYFNPTEPKQVGVVMAGNVPFVGLHDLLTVVITGHKFYGKVSSKDAGLTQAFVDLLVATEPRFNEAIKITDNKLENFDAIIATGSDNTARYFEYYFGKYPNIIRKNRHSVAILTGKESLDDLKGLASDMLSYFGLGCRSVSKLLVPKNYNFEPLMQAMEPYKHLINHNKYANNHEYHRAIYLINQVEHLDNGFVLIKPDESLGSPVGVIYYQHYKDIDSVMSYINEHENSLQCIVSNEPKIKSKVSFGETQKPSLNDYADGIDTIKFLANL
ncbi:MAG: acyl-CoA reductase [Bacteroidales bacterium]